MTSDIRRHLTPAACLPIDAAEALLIGRVWVPSANGPAPVQIMGDDLLDLSEIAPTTSELFERPDIAGEIRARRYPRVASLGATT